MSDLIRKYDVLKICEEQIWNGFDDYYPISANQIAKKVKELPTAQQWIPTSERLPQEDGYYYVTCNYFGMPKVYITEWRNGDWVTFERDELTAWTEVVVPKPYTG